MKNKLNDRAQWLGAIVGVIVLLTSASYGATKSKSAKRPSVSGGAIQGTHAGHSASAPEASSAEDKNVPAPEALSGPSSTSAPVTSTEEPAVGAPTTVVSETVTLPTEGKIVGYVELRPSWTTKSGAVGTENTAELGYQFNPDTSLHYRQELNTNLYNPAGAPSPQGLNAVAGDGVLRASLANLWSDKDTGLSFGYEPRLYLPTSPSKRDAGMISTVRNYLKLKARVSDSVALHLMEIPIFHFYNTAGSANAANPVVENRVYFITDVSFYGGKLTLSVPLMLNSTKYRDYAVGATNNNSTAHILWTYPELDYAVSDNVLLGLAYYSDNLMQPDFSALNIANGLENGVTQIVLRASL